MFGMNAPCHILWSTCTDINGMKKRYQCKKINPWQKQTNKLTEEHELVIFKLHKCKYELNSAPVMPYLSPAYIFKRSKIYLKGK